LYVTIDLASAYWARYFSLRTDEREAFDQAQQRWLHFLNEMCPRASNPQLCILTAYHKRAAGYRTQLKGDALAESRLTPEQHARIQQSLVAAGFLPDQPDGEFGPITRSAIKRYKSQSGMPESEFLTANERERLLRGKSPTAESKLLPPPPPSGSILVPLEKEGGTYVVPVLINGAIPLKFVVDSGAADVIIPADVVSTLLRTGTIDRSDFIGSQTYRLANGSSLPSVRFRLRSLKVGNTLIENVVAAIAPAEGSLLLGQSFLTRFRSWSIDDAKRALLLEPL
jgi:clan AA aspartic protease (TIGR02281 family)